ncbi:MAG: hypothetical protein MUO31_13250 [Thermodesulfovibrionales bacterium]|nr:hypothetical protein [Thermodesulfovibrionales bacterium]
MNKYEELAGQLKKTRRVDNTIIVNKSEYAALKASHDKLKNVCKKAFNYHDELEDFLIRLKMNDKHSDLHNELEQSLAEAEKI